MIKSSKNFSKAFNILLQERNSTEPGRLNDARIVAGHDEAVARSKKLRQYLQDVIEQEKDATKERIEHYSKQQTASLKVFCEKVKHEFEEILSAVDDVPDDRKHFNDGNNFDETIIATENGPNNSKHLLSSHLTPPVTPDSTPMSIGNSPNFRQQTSFLTAGGARISALARNVSPLYIPSISRLLHSRQPVDFDWRECRVSATYRCSRDNRDFRMIEIELQCFHRCHRWSIRPPINAS